MSCRTPAPTCWPARSSGSEPSPGVPHAPAGPRVPGRGCPSTPSWTTTARTHRAGSRPPPALPRLHFTRGLAQPSGDRAGSANSNGNSPRRAAGASCGPPRGVGVPPSRPQALVWTASPSVNTLLHTPSGRPGLNRPANSGSHKGCPYNEPVRELLGSDRLGGLEHRSAHADRHDAAARARPRHARRYRPSAPSCAGHRLARPSPRCRALRRRSAWAGRGSWSIRRPVHSRQPRAALDRFGHRPGRHRRAPGPVGRRDDSDRP